jgi:hypothetical protein
MDLSVYLAAGLALAVGLWAVVRGRRQRATRARMQAVVDRVDRPAQAASPTIQASRSLSDVAPPRPGEAEAVLERLGACLERLYSEPGETGEAGRLFAATGQPLPPEVARAARRVGGDATAGTLIARLSDPRINLAVVAGMIAANPLLTGNVLKIANSPLFGLRAALADVGQAIGLIGLGNVRSLLFAELLENAASQGGLDKAGRTALWGHMAKTAVLARRIAPAIAGLDAGAAYTAGLLHDIGMLVSPAGNSPVDVWNPAGETAAYGVDHGAAGAAVCDGFALPTHLVQAVRLHHAPAFVEMEDLEAETPDIRLALAVGLADALTLVLDGRNPATIPPLRHSYRFLINEPVLADVLADPALLGEVSRTMALLAASRG